MLRVGHHYSGIGCGDLFSKDGEDCLQGVAGLKTGEGRMRGEVYLGFMFVSLQSSVENGRKVRMRSGCGGPGGDSGSGQASAGPDSWRREGRPVSWSEEDGADMLACGEEMD